MLLRVPVVGSETLTPDLQNAAARLYEWPPLSDVSEARSQATNDMAATALIVPNAGA